MEIFHFLQTYFKPALKNIKENLENSGFTDQYVSTNEWNVMILCLNNKKNGFSLILVEKDELWFAWKCKAKLPNVHNEWNYNNPIKYDKWTGYNTTQNIGY